MANQKESSAKVESEGAVVEGSEGEVALLVVRSGLEVLDEVAFFEKDERHPDGEVYVTGSGGEVRAYPTSGVMRAVGEGRLVDVAAEEKAEGDEADEAGMSSKSSSKSSGVVGDEGAVKAE